MENLVLTTACGLHSKQIEFFIKSLRKYFSGAVCFLVNKNDTEIQKLIRRYDCIYHIIKEHKFDVQVKRYGVYLNLLKKTKYKNILICDSRDVYFQSDPFDYVYKGSINFFLESKKIKDCPFNSSWLLKTYGENVLKKLEDEIINCSGTTLGTHNAMMSYLELMVSHSIKFKFKKRLKYLLTLRRDKLGRGADQAYANYIAHNRLINDTFLYSNEKGPIATVCYLDKIIFNNDLQLMNDLDTPYLVVHQYDKRWDEFKKTVEKIQKKLN